MSNPQVTKSSVAVENPWTRIVREELRFESGRIGDYLIVERPPALAILPVLTVDGRLHTALVRQYRHPIGIDVLQFPMGGLDSNRSPEDHAREELRQETGLEMGKLTLLAEFYVDPGLSRQKCLVYLAEDLVECGHQDLEETEADLRVEYVPIRALPELITNGKICDSWTLAEVQLLLTNLSARGVAF